MMATSAAALTIMSRSSLLLLRGFDLIEVRRIGAGAMSVLVEATVLVLRRSVLVEMRCVLIRSLSASVLRCVWGLHAASML